MEVEQVYGLYGRTWKGLVTKEVNSHPAKFSRKLVYWIVQQGLERGWWDYGDVILDPFGGVGLGGIACADYYLNWLGVELEPGFVKIAEDNFELNRERWEDADGGNFLPRIVQGDSRKLVEIVQEQLGGAITSPPYEGTDPSASHAQGASRLDPNSPNYRPYAKKHWEESETPRPYHAVTSPPYGNRVDDHGVDQPGYEGEVEKLGRYGDSEGQLGKLRVGALTSPPYEGQVVRDRSSHLETERLKAKGLTDRSYGMVDGHLAFDSYTKIGGLTSPPYEGTAQSGSRHNDSGVVGRMKAGGKSVGNFRYDDDNQSQNLGNQKGETYWEAVAEIYSQMYQLFSSGSHAAIVVKSFVREKQIVDLPQMTWELLSHIGFKPVLWIDAMLVSEDRKKEYKAFFRRNFEYMCDHRTSRPIDDAYQCKLLGGPCPFYKSKLVPVPEHKPNECSSYWNRRDMGLGIDNEVVLVVKK